MPGDDAKHDAALHRSTVRKLDFILLPFLALLFLLNALDKSNIGNAESAHFTRDIGVEPADLNTAVALFFAFFVALQPVGAALGRRYGMVAWVPSCMLLWGMATLGHVWVRSRGMLFFLRAVIGGLEAGFYPVTVSYLSLFYTRFEFGRRLSVFYGQAAVGGALGGVISYAVFSRFPGTDTDEDTTNTAGAEWKAWQVLFLFEGVLTMVIALVGYVWLPHSAATAWFLTPEEREYATQRIVRDLSNASTGTGDGMGVRTPPHSRTLSFTENYNEPFTFTSTSPHDEESRGLLTPYKPPRSEPNEEASTSDRGLHPHDIAAALFNTKTWHILFINILSAIPVSAFQVFLPLVLAPLTSSPNPALVNLLTAPPYLCGAVTLYLFASYSDRHRVRIVPILYGLGLVIAGLTLVVALPAAGRAWVVPRYVALNVLLAGTFIASPLTVAWISGNTPRAGKRAVMLGVNGWGNLAGVFSAMIFSPEYREGGYVGSFWWTLVCVVAAAGGYVGFLRGLMGENERRREVVGGWRAEEVEAEEVGGRGPVGDEYGEWIGLRGVVGVLREVGVGSMAEWLEGAVEGGREGDEKMTFVYGL